MTVQGQLLYMLETVAEAIGDDLRDRLVFEAAPGRSDHAGRRETDK